MPGLLPGGSRLPTRYTGQGPFLGVPAPHRCPLPHQPPEPPGRASLPRTTGRSPAESLARERLRGQAAGPGRLAGGRRAAVQGAPLANLRRRSPSYVYLGRLTPALPAGRGRPLVGLPVGRWRRSGAFGVSTRVAAARPGCSCCEESARAGPGSGRGWAGGGAESPCSRVPAFAPPPPGGAPAATTQSPAPGAGGARGGDEGNLKSLRSLPSAPPPQAPPLVPRGLLNHPPGYQSLKRRSQMSLDTRVLLGPFPLPRPRPRPRTHTQRSGCGGTEREASPVESHSSRVSSLPTPPAAMSPGRCSAPRQPPGCGPLV